jgi:hypothetical protein
VTTSPATSGPSTPDRSVVKPQQPSGPYKERRNSLSLLMIIWDLLLVLGLALTLIAVVGWFLVVDESICLDRQPVWGPPESGVYTDCSGHIDELLRKWGWVS